MIFPEPSYIGDVIRMKHVNRSLIGGNGRALLDVGAGNGQYFHLAKVKGYSYVGVDLHPGHPDIKEGDAEDLKDFVAESFDVVLLIDVLEHLHHPEKAIAEAFRVLKSNGILVVHVPNKDQTHVLVDPHEQDDHVRKGFDAEELKVLCRDFRIILKSTFSSVECVAWELVYAMMHKLPVDPMKLVAMDWKSYHHLGWLVLGFKNKDGVLHNLDLGVK